MSEENNMKFDNLKAAAVNTARLVVIINIVKYHSVLVEAPTCYNLGTEEEVDVPLAS